MKCLIRHIPDKGKLKRIYVTMHILGTIGWTTGVVWVSPFKEVNNVLVALASPLELTPFTCAVAGYDYHTHVLISILGPMALCVLSSFRINYIAQHGNYQVNYYFSGVGFSLYGLTWSQNFTAKSGISVTLYII